MSEPALSGGRAEPRWRLFVALELPGELRDTLGRWRDGVTRHEPGLRPVGDEDLHITLCFLGAHESAQVAGVLDACERVAGWPAASLRTGEGVWLPRRSPRVLAVTFEDAGGHLASVQSELSEVLAVGGWYRPEPRPFLAHTTVARVRRGARVSARALEPPAPLVGIADAVTLFRSRLSPAGARYEPLGTVRLSRAGPG